MIVDYEFLSSVVNYDTSRVSDYALNALTKYIENDKFTPEYVAQISKFSSLMCEWVISVYRVGMLRISTNVQC
jgi:hypothetical protein